MPIKGVTDQRRLPRIGVIRLGIKDKTSKGVEFPRAVDYFVVKVDDATPEDAATAFHEVYGEKPVELGVMFPTDVIEDWADAFYKMYSRSWGLTCKGTGETARARWDVAQDGPRPEGVESGTWANKDTKAWVSREIPCAGKDCPMQAGERPQCRAVMNLQFVLLGVRGIGVWMISTSSFYSITNVRNNVEMLKAVTGGRVRGLPLKLRLIPRQVSPPGVKAKTVHVLDLSMPGVTMQELADQVARLPAGLLAPAQLDEEEPPEDLFPEAAGEAQEEESPPPTAEEPPAPANKRDDGTGEPLSLDAEALRREVLPALMGAFPGDWIAAIQFIEAHTPHAVSMGNLRPAALSGEDCRTLLDELRKMGA